MLMKCWDSIRVLAVVALCANLLRSSLAAAGEGVPDHTPSLEALDWAKKADELEAQLNRMGVEIDKIGKDGLTDCLKVVGHTAFCECIDEHVPFWASFQAYTDAIIGGEQGMMPYLAEEWRADPKNRQQLLNMMRDARRVCVGKLGFK